MANLSDLRIRISADGSQAARGLAQVQTGLGRLRQESSTTQRQVAALQGAFRGFASQLAAAFGGLSLASSFVEANRAAGLLRASLTTVTGSLSAATVAWRELQGFAAQTPFSLEQSTQAFIRLRALGLDASLESLRSYGNTASAMGKSLIDMVEAVADATTGEFERLKEFGIKAKMEGDQVAITFQGVTTTIGNNAQEIEAYLKKIGKVQFAGAMARQAETLEGAISNLGDAWSQLMVTLGDAGGTEYLVEMLRSITAWIAKLDAYIGSGKMSQDWVDWSIAIDEVSDSLESLGDTWIGDALAAIAEFVGQAGEAFQELPYWFKVAAVVITGEAVKTKDLVVAAIDSLVVQAKILWQNLKVSTLEVWYAIEIAIAGVIARLAGFMRDMMAEAASSLQSLPDLLIPEDLVASLQAGAEKWHGYTDAAADAGIEQRKVQAGIQEQIKVLEAEQDAIEATALTKVKAANAAVDAVIAEIDAERAINQEFAAAVQLQEDLEKGLLNAAPAVKEVTEAKQELATASGGAGKAAKKLGEEQKKLEKDLSAAKSAVDQLIQRYLPAKAAALEYAAALQALAVAGSAAGLSQAEMTTIIQGLERDMARAADAARRESDGFYAAWADAVDALDDTFQGLWRGLISGQGDVLGDLKETVLEWIADLSYQLLLSPLVVPIQGALKGMLGGGAAGVTGTATGVLGTASNLGGMSNMFSGLSSAFNVVTNLFSGATFSGVSTGFGLAMQNISAGGYFGAMGTNLALAGSSASSGAMGTALGAMAPYAIPVAAIAAVGMAIFSKWQKDQEPRYGTLAAMTGGSVRGLEDWENGPANYSRGAFGLTLGITDKGSKNIKASELQKTYDALAQVTDALAEFFGEDLTNFITEELKTLSTFGDGLIHLTENEGDLGAAMAMLVEHIALAAGRSSEDIGVAFAGMVGDLGGTAEEVGEQIQSAMMAAAMAVELSSRYDDRIGEMLSLTGEIGTDVDLLRGYIDQFGKSGELSGETLTRLVTQLGILDSAAEQTATDLAGLSTTALITLSDELVQAMGGVDRAASQMAFFYDQFTSASEKLADAVSAAADTIGREIPKLQDGLMQLSEDVTTTVTTVVEDIQQGISGIALPSTGDSGNYWAGMRDKLVDRFGEDMARMMVSIQDQSTGVADSVNEYWAKMRDKLVDRFGEDLVRMIDVVHGTAENAVRSIAIESEKVTKTITTETTVKGDPNAAILASLLNELPKTRQGFEDLISAIDLTTEAGRKLYAGLMELAPQFDLLYDGVEAFTDWLLGVNEVERATRELERVFQDLGLVMPQNRDALLELYQSGALSAEQMAVLAAYLKELGLVFDQVADDVEELKDGISQLQLDRIKRAYSGLDQAANAEREVINTTYQARMDAIAAEREVIDQQHQDRLAAIASERDAANAAYQSRIDAIAAEREALAEANREQLDALSKQRDAAQEALSVAQAGLNRIQSALSNYRDEAPRNDLERMRALRQLNSWAASGRLPEEDALDRAITGATNLDAQNFTSENAYRAAQGSAYSALLALEKVGIKQVSDAEKQIQAIERASERAQESYENQLKALDAQAEQAAAQRDATLEILARQEKSAIAWRDQELARLDAEAEAATAWRDANLASIDALLAEATKQIAILEGTYIETKTIAEALAELNAALIDAGGEPLQPVQAGLADMLPPLEDIALAESATTNEVIILRQEIVTLRKDLAAVNTAQVVALKSIDERLRKWDLDGMPSSTETGTETALRAA